MPLRVRQLPSISTLTKCPSISGHPIQSQPAEPTLADATAMFRVTSDMASSLAMDGQSTEKLVVNSVGNILRHETLRRLKKVSRPCSLDGLCAENLNNSQ